MLNVRRVRVRAAKTDVPRQDFQFHVNSLYVVVIWTIESTEFETYVKTKSAYIFTNRICETGWKNLQFIWHVYIIAVYVLDHLQHS